MKEDLNQLRLSGVARLSDASPHQMQDLYRVYGKRCLDGVLGIALLIVCFPVLVVLAIVVALDGGAPVFSHQRVGRGGRMFPCHKFRTMRVDAAQALADHLRQNPEARREWRAHQKLKNDPRVTRVGRFLRRTSLDELPQLVNVVCGQMSIVGPRPVTVEELDRYSVDLPKYLALRPGVTGMWQVHGRGHVSYDERVQMDARYFREMSFWGDLALILKTTFVVVRRQGQ